MPDIFSGNPRGVVYFQITLRKNSIFSFLQVETKLYHSILCPLLGNLYFPNRNKYSRWQGHGGHWASWMALFRNLPELSIIKTWLL